MNEPEFIIQLKQGDAAAFNELVQVYRNHVLNICYRFVLDRELAEDISQEVFIEVFHSIRSFRGDARLSTWIYRIATTKSLDEIKKQKRKKRISSIGRTLGLEQVAGWLAGNDRPDTRIETDERFRLLVDALNSLPDNQRIALTLSKVEGYTSPEIAAVMNTTLSAVDSLIYRAKQQLQIKLEQQRKNEK